MLSEVEYRPTNQWQSYDQKLRFPSPGPSFCSSSSDGPGLRCANFILAILGTKPLQDGRYAL